MGRYRFSVPQPFADLFGENIGFWMAEHLNRKCGVYAFLDDDEIVYIGKSKDLFQRIPTSFTSNADPCVNQIKYFLTPTMTDATILEILLISNIRPFNNEEFNDGYPPKLFSTDIDIYKDFSSFPDWYDEKKYPSMSQQSYAWDISRVLEIDMPQELTREAYRKFISTNKEEFEKKANGKIWSAARISKLLDKQERK